MISGETIKDQRLYAEFLYSDIKKLMKAYRRLPYLLAASEMGDYTSCVISVDLREALIHSNITDIQKTDIIAVLIYAVTEKEQAEYRNVSQEAVHYSIIGGLKRISKYLVS